MNRKRFCNWNYIHENDALHSPNIFYLYVVVDIFPLLFISLWVVAVRSAKKVWISSIAKKFSVWFWIYEESMCSRQWISIL